MTALRFQKFRLNGGLDALCDGLKSEIEAHHDDRAYDGRVLAGGLRADLLDETAIDLDPRERISRQIAQRCIASSEIIECNSDTFGSQLLERGEGSFLMTERDVLGDFKLKRFGR